MSTIQLQIPDDLRANAQTRAAQEGFASLDQYITSLIRADQYNGPSEITAESQDRLEHLLREGLASGAGRGITDSDWQQKKELLKVRFGPAKQ